MAEYCIILQRQQSLYMFPSKNVLFNKRISTLFNTFENAYICLNLGGIFKKTSSY